MAKNTRQSGESDDTPETAVQGASATDANGDHTPAKTPRKPRAKKADAEAPADGAAEAPARPRRTPAARKPKADAPADGASEEKPKPVRKSRAKKVTPDESSEPADEKPKPVRKPRAKKVAEPAAESASEEAPKPVRKPRAKKAVAEVPADGASEEAPKPVRKSRITKVDLTSAAQKAAVPSTPVPEADAPAESTAPPRRRRKTREAEPVASSDNLPAESQDEARTSDRDQHDRDDRSQGNRQNNGGNQNRNQDDRESGNRQDHGGNQNRGNNQGGQNQGGNPNYDNNEGGGRRRKKRNRNKNRGHNDGGTYNQGGQNNGGNQGGGQHQGGNQNQGGGQNNAPAEPFEGILELIGDKKFGFVRQFTTSLTKGDNDPFMPPPLIQKYRLRDGVAIKGTVKPGRKGAWQVVELTEIMGGDPDTWADTPDFDDGLVIYPDEKLKLVTDKDDISMRVVDLVAPIGKGQRGLIVAPPRAGKTILIKQIAEGLSQNHPKVKLVALLIDERPEEVTDFKRNTAATVFASSNDYGEDNHIRVATISFEYSRRLVEQGHDVVILLDSLTRLGRTFNMFGNNLSGRTMSGGIDARALLIPRKIFGAARNIEDGGSLTIVATALIETGSRMDDVIFEEFKGTGNSEIVLDREMSEQRIYPAINIRKSGTRNEDRLVDPNLLRQRHMLLRALNSRHPVEAMQALAKQLQLSDSNEDLLQALVPE